MKKKIFVVLALSASLLGVLSFTRAMVVDNTNQLTIAKQETCLEVEPFPEYTYKTTVVGQKCWQWTSYDDQWWLMGNEQLCTQPSPNWGPCHATICKTWWWTEDIKCYLGAYPPAEDTVIDPARRKN